MIPLNIEPRRHHRPTPKRPVSPESKIFPGRRDRLKHPIKSDIKSLFGKLKKSNQ